MTCQAHDDLSSDVRSMRAALGAVLTDTAVIRVAVEKLGDVTHRLTVLEERVGMLRSAQRRWSGLFPSIIASVGSSAITGALVYMVTGG